MRYKQTEKKERKKEEVTNRSTMSLMPSHIDAIIVSAPATYHTRNFIPLPYVHCTSRPVTLAGAVSRRRKDDGPPSSLPHYTAQLPSHFYQSGRFTAERAVMQKNASSEIFNAILAGASHTEMQRPGIPRDDHSFPLFSLSLSLSFIYLSIYLSLPSPSLRRLFDLFSLSTVSSPLFED